MGQFDCLFFFFWHCIFSFLKLIFLGVGILGVPDLGDPDLRPPDLGFLELGHFKVDIRFGPARFGSFQILQNSRFGPPRFGPLQTWSVSNWAFQARLLYSGSVNNR